MQAILLILLSNAAIANKMTATVTPINGGLYDSFVFELTIEGQLESRIELPNISHLEMGMQSLSRQVQIINGQYSSQTVISIPLRPDALGTYTIPPITAKVDQDTVTSNEVSFEVVDSPRHVSPRSQTHSGLDTTDHLPDMFIDRTFDKELPVYVGEVIVETARLYYGIQINGLGGSGHKNLQNFKLLHQTKGAEIGLTTIGSKRYQTIEWIYAVSPTLPGRIPIEPFSLEVSFDNVSSIRDFASLFRQGFTDKKQLASPDATIEVKALPKDKKPNSFQGLVGTFHLKSSLEPQNIKVLESTTLTVEVKGNGSLDGLQASDIGLDLPPSIKVYPDKVESHDEIKNGTFVAKKTFRYALIPSEPGEFNLKSVRLNYFHPESARYKTLSDHLPSLVVTGVKASTSVENKKIKKQNLPPLQKDLGQDINDLIRRDTIPNLYLSSSKTMSWFILSQIIPFLMLTLFLLVRSRLKKPRSGLDHLIHLTKVLKPFMADPAPENPLAFTRELLSHIRKVVNQATDHPSSSLTGMDLRNLSSHPKYVDYKFNHLAKVVEKLESLSYAQSSPSAEKLTLVKKDLKEWLDLLLAEKSRSNGKKLSSHSDRGL